jgi:hypothetical protein
MCIALVSTPSEPADITLSYWLDRICFRHWNYRTWYSLSRRRFFKFKDRLDRLQSTDGNMCVQLLVNRHQKH